MRKLLLELWFLIYSIMLLPSWALAVFFTWRESETGAFIWVSPMGYARYSRSTFNALIAMVLWGFILTVLNVMGIIHL